MRAIFSSILAIALIAVVVVPQSNAIQLRLSGKDTSKLIFKEDDTKYLFNDAGMLNHDAIKMKLQEPIQEVGATLIHASKMAAEALQKPLIPFKFEMVADSATPRADATGGVAILSYHKTGHVLAKQIASMMVGGNAEWDSGKVQGGAHACYASHSKKCRKHFGEDFFYMKRNMSGNEYTEGFHDGKATRSTYTSFYDGDVSAKDGKFVVIDDPAHTISISENIRTVHFYRNPISKILSAYRYHMGKGSAEFWEGHESQCHACDDDAHAAIFDACDYKCNYFQLLNSANWTDGIVFEALQSRQELLHMLKNLQRWANDKNVLHLSVDQLPVSFDDTMQCMLNFLGTSSQSHYMKKLQQLDISRQKNISRHVTSGKYNNTDLKAFLESHAFWAPQFQQVQKQEREIFERQAKLYGCPLPPSVVH